MARATVRADRTGNAFRFDSPMAFPNGIDGRERPRRGTPGGAGDGVPDSRLPPGGGGPKEPALLRSASGEAEARDLTQLHCTGKSTTLNRPPKRGNLKQFMETAGVNGH